MRQLCLPPNTQDSSYGKLKLEIGQVHSLQYGSTNYPLHQSNYLLQFHVSFFGEQEATVLRYVGYVCDPQYRAANTERALLYPNVATYDVRTNVANIMKYLEDMQALSIGVYDTALKQTIGVVSVPLKLYFNRNLRPATGVHTFIELDDKLPVFKAANQKEKIGEIQVRIEGTSAFENPEDSRLPNSMATQAAGKSYASGKYQTTGVDYMKTMEEMRQKLEMTRRRAASSSRFRRAPPKREEFHDEPERVSDKSSDESATQKDIERILERGRELKGKMEQTLKTGTREAAEAFAGNQQVWSMLHGEAAEKQIVPPNVNALDFEVNSVTDSLSDFDKYHPSASATKAVPDASKENFQAENLPATVPGTVTLPLQAQKNAKDIKKMIVSMVGISFKSEEMRKKLLGHNIFVVTKLPIAEYGSAKIHEEEMKVQLMLDQRAATGIVELNRVHECGLYISDDNFASLVGSKFAVELQAELEDDNIFQLFGRGELSFQKVFLAPGYKLDALIHISYVAPQAGNEPAASRTGKKRAISAKPVASGTKGKTQQIAKNKLKKIAPVTQVAELRLVVELSCGDSRPAVNTLRASAPEEEISRAAMIGLLLSIRITRAREVVLRKYESEQTQIFRNLYVRYKSFPTGETMSTPIVWGNNSPFFGHTMQYPLFLTADIITKLANGMLVFELWDKHSAQGASATLPSDELVGLVKVPLRSFNEALKSQLVAGAYTAHHILVNAYPFILVDDYLPVMNPRLGQAVGALEVTVAVGTPVQIQRLDSREGKEKDADDSKSQKVFGGQETERQAPAEVQPAVTARPKEDVGTQEELKEPPKAEKGTQSPTPPAEKQKSEAEPQSPPQLPAKEERKESEPAPSPPPQPKSEVQPPVKEPTQQPAVPATVPEAKTEEKKEAEARGSLEDIHEIAMLLNPPQEPAVPAKEEKRTEERENEDLVKMEENPSLGHEEPVRQPQSVPARPQPAVTSPMKLIETVVAPISIPSPPAPKPKFIKHKFAIEITELSSIPVLARFAMVADQRALNLYLRASLPFDRTPVESESIMQMDRQTYKVAMECSYSLLLPTESTIQSVTQGLQQDISIELCSLDAKSHSPVIIGTAELPVEDIKLLVENKSEISQTASIERVVFVYGTTASDREGVIIGKVKLKLGYDLEPSSDLSPDFSGQLWQQERVVNREIPVNCRMMIYVNNIDGIDESRAGKSAKSSGLPPAEQLNLSVHYNPVGEIIHVEPKDFAAARAENEHATKVVYCSAEPRFKSRWYVDFTVDQPVLTFLEHESATFEVRHTVPQFTADQTFGMSKVAPSEGNTILVGVVRVPMIRLLSTHAGIINEALEIKDRCNNCFGYLHISMNILDAGIEVPKEEEKSAAVPEEKKQKSPAKAATMEPVAEKLQEECYPLAEFEVTIESGLRIKNPIDSTILSLTTNRQSSAQYLCSGQTLGAALRDRDARGVPQRVPSLEHNAGRDLPSLPGEH